MDRRIGTNSAARHWPAIAFFIGREAALGQAAAARGSIAVAAYELLRFGLKQGWACLFGAMMLALLVATHVLYPAHAALARYDLLFLAALTLQIVMLATGLETLEEAKVICAFHVIGTLMELHKTSIGSWVYPETSLVHIAGVPLFSGFMYASVGSYIARVWRLFDFRFTRHPSVPATLALSAAIYANFFADHYGFDMRLGLIGVTALLFGRTTIHFRIWRSHRAMPLALGFVLVALFIWFGENIGTASHAWLYPRQMQGWAMVPWSKLSSWVLLMIISYTLVAWINGIRAPQMVPAPAAVVAA